MLSISSQFPYFLYRLYTMQMTKNDIIEIPIIAILKWIFPLSWKKSDATMQKE